MASKKQSDNKAAAQEAPAKQAAPKQAAAKKAATQKSPTASAATKRSSAKKASVNKAADKAPKPKSSYGKKFIDDQEQSLLKERARYTKSAEIWKAEADSLLVDRDPGDVQFDEESGDGDTLQVERERDLALSSYAQNAVDEIDEALARVKAGTYGMCVTSGKPIPKERLEAIPWAAERVEYKVAGFRR